MRLSNRHKINQYSIWNTCYYLLLIVGFLLYFLEESRFDVIKGHYSLLLIVVPLVCLIIHRLRGRQIFEYDSDGEALNFKNRGLPPFVGKIASDEFPKYKLDGFDTVSLGLFKRLYVYVDSKKAKQYTLKYDISYLTNKELMDLRKSLQKVVKNNSNNKNTTR